MKKIDVLNISLKTYPMLSVFFKMWTSDDCPYYKKTAYVVSFIYNNSFGITNIVDMDDELVMTRHFIEL